METGHPTSRSRLVAVALLGVLAGGLLPMPAAAGAGFGVTVDPRGGDKAPGQRYRDSTVLVEFRPGTPAAERRSARAGLGPISHAPISPLAGDAERWTLPAGLTVEAAVAALSRNPNVRFAEPDYVRTVDAVPNDPGYTNNYLWGLYSPGGPPPSSSYGTRADLAWAGGVFGRQSVHVGVIDTGMDVSHPDLAPNAWTNPFETPGNGLDDDGNGYVDDVHGWDFFNDDASVFDDVTLDGHGTHVAGTIGAAGGNGTGVVGVSWSITLISLKFIEDVGYDSDAVAAIDYLTDLKTRHGLDIPVSNNSWGGEDAGTAVRDAIARAADEDILFVAAAGNAGANLETTPFYPAAWTCTDRFDDGSPRGYDCIVSVAAIDANGHRPSFSNYGATSVDLGAPGSAIVSTYPANQYAEMSGTSMAAPHVTGAIGLLAGCQGAPTPASLRAAILSAGVPTTSMSGITVTGDRLDVGPFAGLCDDARPRAVLSAAPGPVTDGSATYTAWFSEPVTGLAAGDFTLGGSSTGWSVLDVTGSGAGPYAITLGAAAPTDGTLVLTLKADAVAGATETGPQLPVRAVNLAVAGAPPTASLTAPASPTKAATLAYSLTFSEPVSGLTAGDFTRTGTASGCVVGAPAGSGAAWSVNVTGCSGGTVTLGLKANSVLDLGGQAGPPSAVAAASVTIDRTAPTTSGPRTTIRTGVSLSGTSLPIRTSWTGSDAGGAGIVRYELQRSTDGGTTWTTIGTSLTGTTYNSSVPTSGSRRFRVRAVDAAGNVGAWVAGPKFLPRLVQQTSSAVIYSGAWASSSSSSYSGGSARYTGVAGRSARYTFTGRAVAFVTTLAAARGQVRIYVDGVLKTTLDLRSSTTTYRRLAYATSWTAKGTHTIRIVVVGTSGRPRVDLDAFAVLK